MSETYVMGSDGDSDRSQHLIDSIVNALNEDFHEALLDFVKTENENIWANLYEPTEAGLLALQRLDSSIAVPASAGVLKATLQSVNGELRTFSFFVMLSQIHDYFRQDKNSSYLRDLISEDEDFRQIYTLWKWAQAGAEQEKRGFADLKRQYKEMEHVRDIRAGTARILASQPQRDRQGIDLDSEATEEDTENVEKLMAIIFSLVRSGQIDEASELARKKGAACLCVLLNIYSLIFDPSLSPRQEESTFTLCSRSLVRFHSTIKRLIPTDDVHSRMLRCAVCGFMDPLLSLATRTDDRLWAIANASVIAKFYKYMGVEVSSECPQTVAAIFSLAAGDEMSPYYKVMNLLLLEKWKQVLEWAVGRKGDTETVRMRAALAILCYIRMDRIDDPSCSSVLLEYITFLRNRSLYHLIPFYASFLSTELAAKCLRETMNSMHTADDRAQFLRASEEASFNKNVLSRGVALSAVEGINNSERGASEAVDKWKWLLFDEETFPEALCLADSLIRRFLLSNSLDQAKHIMTECASRAVPDALRSSLSVVTQRALAEFENHQLYLEALDVFDNFMQRVMETQTQLQTIESGKGEGKEEKKQRLRARLDVQKEKAADVLVKLIRHKGWKNVTSGREEEEEERHEQLSSLRDRVYRSVLDKLMTVYESAHDTQGILDVASLIAESPLNLPQHISKANLRALLDRVHRLAGHILTDS